MPLGIKFAKIQIAFHSRSSAALHPIQIIDATSGDTAVGTLDSNQAEAERPNRNEALMRSSVKRWSTVDMRSTRLS